MQVLIDGKPVECKTIELIEEDLIIGCTCAGGYHKEINGSSRITIDEKELTAEMLDVEGGVEYSAVIDLPELFEDMTRTVIRMRHKLDNMDEFLDIEHSF